MKFKSCCSPPLWTGQLPFLVHALFEARINIYPQSKSDLNFIKNRHFGGVGRGVEMVYSTNIKQVNYYYFNPVNISFPPDISS